MAADRMGILTAALLQASLAFGGLAGLAGCATMPRMGNAPSLAACRFGGHSAAAGADPRPSRPHLRHHASACGPSGPRAPTRYRTDRRHAGRAQLRAWRQRLVAVLGFGQRRGAKGDGRQPARDRGDRLRRVGLTSAIVAQRAGAQVTIYARDMYSRTRSARATGSWTPDSRICLTEPAGPNSAICGSRWRAIPTRPIAIIWACRAGRWISPTTIACPTRPSADARRSPIPCAGHLCHHRPAAAEFRVRPL